MSPDQHLEYAAEIVKDHSLYLSQKRGGFGDLDLEARATAILVRALELATPDLTGRTRAMLFEQQEE